jgi:hypothetical protein
MQISDQSTIQIPQGAPVSPSVPLPTLPVSDVGTAGKKDRGADQRRETQRSTAQFRALLDAVTVSGLGLKSGEGTSKSEPRLAPKTVITRTPEREQQLDGKDTADLYRAVRAYAAHARAEKPSRDSERESDTTADSVPAHVAFAAARRYAERFFSVGSAFAMRGETLELST